MFAHLNALILSVHCADFPTVGLIYSVVDVKL